MTRAGLALAVLALFALPLVLGPLGLRMAVEILYLGLLAVAFNLLFGYAGMLSFGFNVTFAIGAYAYAILAADVPEISFVGDFALATLIGAASGALIGALCVRLHGGYFSLLTLAFAQFFAAIALKWRAVTKGEDGLIVAPPAFELPGFGQVRLDVEAHIYVFTLVVVLACLGILWRFTKTPLGEALVLNRENSERAAFLGYNAYALKLFVFTLASAFAAIAGVLFALFQRLVSPSLLGLGQAGDILFMTVLGGSGAFLGPMAGALVYELLQDWLARTTEHWQFFLGLLFVLLVIFAPDGLTGLARALRARSPIRPAEFGARP
ncbi:MAG: branched-chain amino acid ABC transporter permease [Roseiarcus sp.]